MKKTKVNYDEENDILWVHINKRVKDSLEIDNFVIDYSYDDKVVGVEIFDASKILSQLSLEKISKQELAKIREVYLSFYRGREIGYILFVLFLSKGKISVPIPTPVRVLN